MRVRNDSVKIDFGRRGTRSSVVAVVLLVELFVLAAGCTPAAPSSEIVLRNPTALEETISSYCPRLKDNYRAVFQAAALEAESEFRVDDRLVLAVITVESRCRHQVHSPKGAQGAMQLMPRTARSLGVIDPLSARQSVRGGSQYLGILLKQFNGDITRALAAYNAGPTAVRKHDGVPPFAETERYVAKVLGVYRDYQAAM